METARHFIIGTAGHIDHGKTALVKALTGINADRLKEEQERGMTIDLGYAFLDVAGRRVGIVDVPGHEKFVKNMLAGATGIDLALLLVAADDGVMPQTVEHLEILDLLRITRGIVVITKIDLVTDDLLGIVREEIQSLRHGTSLEGSDIVEVSSVTGKGIEDLKRKIGEMVSGAESHRPLGLPFRMPIDRVFTQEGFGCVVTGSVMTGETTKGAVLEIVPGGMEVRVRGIEVHGAELERAMAGQRAALNLSGAKAEQIARGCVLSEPGRLIATGLVDADLRFLKTAGSPPKHNARVRLHMGTSEVMARVSILQGDRLAPGESGFVQFKLEGVIATQRGDRYVIRSYSPMRTIGGGRVLRRETQPLKRNRNSVIEALGRLAGDNPKDIVEQTVLDAPPFTLTPARIAHVAELSGEQVKPALDALIAGGIVKSEKDARLAHTRQLEWAREEALRVLEKFHASHRIDVGMVPAQLMSHVRVDMPRDVFERILQEMKGKGLIKEVGGLVALADFEPRLSADERASAEKLEAVFESAGFAPPLIRDAIAQAGHASGRAEPILEMLVRSGRIVRLGEDLCFHASAIDRIKTKVVTFLREKGAITVAELKDLLGVSRKFAIPILEYLDKIGMTERAGDKRRLKPPR